MKRIGLVLGAGGSAGIAYHGGVLAALNEATGWEPRSAEVIVGTSAGSLTGSMLRLGLRASDLTSISEGKPLSPEGETVAAKGRPHRPRWQATDLLRLRVPSYPGALLNGIRHPRQSSIPALVAALLPAGAVSTETITGGLDAASAGSWPSDALWLCAVRLRDGKLTVFGSEGAPEATIGQAVGASCAIPSYFRPVEIGGERYVDGGVHSIHNAGLLAGLGLDMVIVSAPMARSGHHRILSADLAIRVSCRVQLEREMSKLSGAGTECHAITPNARVATAMGLNVMDASHRGPVSRVSKQATLDYLERSEPGRRITGALRDAARASEVVTIDVGEIQRSVTPR